MAAILEAEAYAYLPELSEDAVDDNQELAPLAKIYKLPEVATSLGATALETGVDEPILSKPKHFKSPERNASDLADLRLVLAAQTGDSVAMNTLLEQYTSLVRFRTSAYFLTGSTQEDLMQEGMIGLYEAVRDYDPTKGASLRTFADLCITRQIIEAIEKSNRFKHQPLNEAVSFEHVVGNKSTGASGILSLGDSLPNQQPSIEEVVISTQEIQSLVFTLATGLSPFESNVLRLYLEANSYEEMAQELGVHEKSIDNALQRVRHKVIAHQKGREALAA